MENINEQLEALREKFREDLPARLEGILNAFSGVAHGKKSQKSSEALEALISSSHKLTGAAGTFGFNRISEISREIEDTCLALSKKGAPLSKDAYQELEKMVQNLTDETGAKTQISISENFDWLSLKASQEVVSEEGVRKILFVDDDMSQSEALTAQLAHFQFETTWLGDVAELSPALKKDTYDAVIMDIIFPGGDDAGVKAVQKAREEGLLGCPVIFISIRDDLAARLGAVRAGCDGYLVKPVDIVDIVDVLKHVTHVSVEDHYRVTVIDDDPDVASRNALLLEGAGAMTKVVTDPLYALEVIQEMLPDVILMDVDMPGCNGFELAGVIRQKPELLQIPIVFLTAFGGKKRQKMALRSGGDDFIEKSESSELVVDAVMQRARKSRTLNKLIRRLRSSEKRFRAVSESANEAIITVNETGQIVFWNAGAEETFGYTGISILGQNVEVIVPENLRETFRAEAEKIIENGLSSKRRSFESYCLSRTGEEVPVECSLTQWDESGHKYFTATLKNITKRKENEEAIRSSEERVRLLLGAVGEGIYGLDVDGKTSFVNPEACIMLGYSEEELVGKPMHDLVHHTYPDGTPFPKEECAMYKAFNEGVIQRRNDEVLWRKDGTSFPVEYTSTPLISKGEILGAVIVFHDISERLEIEKEIKSLARFPEENPSPILRIDADGNVIYANAPALKFSSEENRHAAGCNAGDWNKIMVHARTRSPASNLEVSCGGRVYSFMVSPSETSDDVNIYGVDITQRKMAENRLKLATQEADNANRAKSQFLSSMSHELRTPLNAILGFAQILETDADAPLNQDQLESVEQILASGKHLLDLIGDVLDLSKVESGSVDISVEDVDISPILAESAILMETQAKKMSVTVNNLVPETESVYIKADYVRLKQVFLNFLSNAVKYNREGGEVTISAEPQDNGKIRISISDTGEGMSPEDMKQLFEPFNRLGHENSSIEGTGIGLTITKRLVEMMGGEIGVSSRPSEGSTFWVEFDKSQGLEKRAEKAEEAIESLPSIPVQKGEKAYKVLYVEDNPSNMKLIRNLIMKLPQYEFLEATTAEDGLELAFSQMPEIILMDINLPGASGFDALEVLQDQGMTDQIAVIALSANATQEDKEKGRKAGFFDYLTKPVDISELVATMERAAQKL